MRILHRILILVTIPIVVGAANVGFLTQSLTKLIDLLEASKHQVALMQEINSVLVNFSQALGELTGSFSNRTDPERNHDQAVKFLAAAKASMDKVRVLGANDKESIALLSDDSINETFTSFGNVLQNSSFAGDLRSSLLAIKELKPTFLRAARVTDACQKLLARARQNQELIEIEQRASLQNLYTCLYALAITSAVLMITAILLFNTIIDRRLSVVLKNAQRLPTLQTLEKPLTGADEFSELDKAVREAFTRLALGKEFRNNVLSMVAHDLRSPLTSINMGIETLRDRMPDDGTSQRKLENISKSINRMILQISGFLDMQKLEFGKLEIKSEETTMSEVVNKVFDSVEDMATSKKVRLELTNNTDKVNLDGEKVSQVLSNLIANSIKYAPKGSAVTVEVEPSGDHGIECRVIDRGPGLTEEVRNRLFHKYVTGEAVDWMGQSGLGLFIAGWIVQSHGGEIGLKPQGEEKGSTFWFTIPNCR